MCEPTTLMTIATVAQGVSQMQAANAQADVAEQNAKLAQEKVADVEYEKQQQIAKLNEQKRQVQGAQRAAMAANNIDSSYGSGLSALTDTAYGAQQDINETEFNAAKQEWGYKMEANNYRYQAAAAKQAGKGALLGSVLSTAGQGYANKSTVSNKWQNTTVKPVDINFAPQYNPNTWYKNGFKSPLVR